MTGARDVKANATTSDSQADRYHSHCLQTPTVVLPHLSSLFRRRREENNAELFGSEGHSGAKTALCATGAI